MIRFIQHNCSETNKIDLRQANAVKKHKPDIIILEYPSDLRLDPKNKRSFGQCEQREKAPAFPKQTLKRCPWLKSDLVLWHNIQELRENGKGLSVYAADAPSELVREWFEVWKNMYPSATKNWLWWVRIYIRERFMAEHVRWILEQHQKQKNLTVLIFLEKFHWIHVQFLLTNPTKKQIWNYYFARFPEVTPKTIGAKIKENNALFSKYWAMWS